MRASWRDFHNPSKLRILSSKNLTRSMLSSKTQRVQRTLAKKWFKNLVLRRSKRWDMASTRGLFLLTRPSLPNSCNVRYFYIRRVSMTTTSSQNIPEVMRMVPILEVSVEARRRPSKLSKGDLQQLLVEWVPDRSFRKICLILGIMFIIPPILHVAKTAIDTRKN